MDRETVITHLQIIHTWAEFARERDLQFFTAKHLEDIAQWADDALNLLKEQLEIVRCKDCTFGRPTKDESGSDAVRCFSDVHPLDWFCADCVRKTS